jgi:hypothetical protein
MDNTPGRSARTLIERLFPIRCISVFMTPADLAPRTINGATSGALRSGTQMRAMPTASACFVTLNS